MAPRIQLRPATTLLRTYATPTQFPRPASSTASSSSSTSLDPPSTPKSKSRSRTQSYSGPDRVYTPRKTFLWEYYDHLLTRAKLVLLFEHDNLNTANLSKIRDNIKKLPPPEVTKKGETVLGEKAKLTICRTGVFAALSNKKYANHDDTSSASSISLTPWLTGQRALLTAQDLSPKYLNGILRAIERGVKQSHRDGSEKQPMMKLIVGVVEGTSLIGAKEVERIAKLPELGQLRGQVVGVLEQNSRNLVGVLSQAGGGGLVRTLQGLEKSMSDAQDGGAEGETKAE